MTLNTDLIDVLREIAVQLEKAEIFTQSQKTGSKIDIRITAGPGSRDVTGINISQVANGGSANLTGLNVSATVSSDPIAYAKAREIRKLADDIENGDQDATTIKHRLTGIGNYLMGEGRKLVSVALIAYIKNVVTEL